MNHSAQTYGVRLTSREKEIRVLIFEDLTSKLIAARLSISEYTVANHRKKYHKEERSKKSDRSCAPINDFS